MVLMYVIRCKIFYIEIWNLHKKLHIYVIFANYNSCICKRKIKIIYSQSKYLLQYTDLVQTNGYHIWNQRCQIHKYVFKSILYNVKHIIINIKKILIFKKSTDPDRFVNFNSEIRNLHIILPLYVTILW